MEISKDMEKEVLLKNFISTYVENMDLKEKLEMRNFGRKRYLKRLKDQDPKKSLCKYTSYVSKDVLPKSIAWKREWLPGDPR